MQEESNKVGAISTFLDQLEKLTQDPNKGRTLYFRGHSRASYKLVPSLYRNDGWVKNEARMLNELIVRCPNDFPEGMSTFKMLVKMQHYSLPTRLLDLTSNPLVALFNACTVHENNDEDGEVIIFGFDTENEVKYFDSDTVSVISNLSHRPYEFQIPKVDKSIADDEKRIESFNKTKEIKLLLHDIRQDKPHFQPLIQPDHLHGVICVKPILDNPRIIRQDGAFMLFGVDGEKSKPAQLNSERIVGRIQIKKPNKKDLLSKLELLGISEATMFPEIERVAIHIKNKYKLLCVDKSELSNIEIKIYEFVSRNGSINHHEMANKLQLSPLSVRLMLNKLQEKGLVEKIGSKLDMRWRAVAGAKLV